MGNIVHSKRMDHEFDSCGCKPEGNSRDCTDWVGLIEFGGKGHKV